MYIPEIQLRMELMTATSESWAYGALGLIVGFGNAPCGGFYLPVVNSGDRQFAGR
jgi:hypothetical protein